MKTHAFWASTSLDWLIEFPNLISLTLLYHASQISMYTEYLTRLSLSNDNQFNFHIITDVLKSLKVAIQRLEIHSYGAVCSHLFWNSSDLIYPQNDNIRFLLIDIGDGRVPSFNECSHEYQFCFLKNIINLVKSLPNIRQVCFRTNRSNLWKLFDVDQWRTVFVACRQLNEIRMEIFEGFSEREQFLQQTIELQNDQPTVRFQLVCL